MRLFHTIAFALALVSGTALSMQTHSFSICEKFSSCQKCIESHTLSYRALRVEKSVEVYGKTSDSKPGQTLIKKLTCSFSADTDWVCMDGRAEVKNTSNRIFLRYVGSPLVVDGIEYEICNG